MGDRIESLPVDELPPSYEEKDMIQWMYHKQGKEIQTNDISHPTTIRFEIQSMLILFLCCLLFSSQWKIVDSFFPVFQKIPFLAWILKSVLFTIVLIVFFNYYYLKQFINN